MTISGDIYYEPFEKIYPGIGSEINIKRTVFLRCGYDINSITREGKVLLTLGFGFKHGNFHFDYSDSIITDSSKKTSIKYVF